MPNEPHKAKYQSETWGYVQTVLMRVGSEEIRKFFPMTLFIYKAHERKWSNNRFDGEGKEVTCLQMIVCFFTVWRSAAVNLLLGSRKRVTAALGALTRSVLAQ